MAKEKLTLQLRVALELLRVGLTGLDGFYKAVGEKAVPVPFKFSDDVRARMAKNRRALRHLNDLDQDIQLELIREIMDNNEATFIPEGDDAKQSLYALRMTKRLKEPHELELWTFKREELFVENKNPINATIEDALAPIIEGAITAPKPEEPPGGEA